MPIKHDSTIKHSSIIKYVISRLIIFGLVIIAVTWVVTPFIISILYALADPEQYYDMNVIVPTKYTWEHVKKLFYLGADKYMINSVIVALLTILFSFILGLPAGYAFAKFIFPGRDTLKLLIVGLRMFPIMVIAVPLVTLYIRLGLDDTLIGVALAHTAMALPFVVLITSSIFASIPKELEEAALIFGLTRMGAFIRITLPLALPGLTAAAMFTFIMSWNEVFIAAVLTLTNRTLPAFILTMVGTAPDFMKFAGAFIMIIPTLIFVFIARRYLITMWGITMR